MRAGALASLAAMMRRSPRVAIVAQRALIAIPVLVGATLLTFIVLDLLPGNAAEQLQGMEATPEQIARMEAELNLNRPAAERYLDWLAGSLHGDFGHSLASRQPVARVVAGRVWVTLQLVAYAFAISLTLAVAIALLAARHARKLVDRVIMLISMAGLSIAGYVLALLLVLLFAVKLRWFPSLGYTPISEGVLANLRSLTLPATALALPLLCFYIRFLRGDLVEQLDRGDYVTTARAKGLGPWRILVHHALRNSVFGLLTVVGLNISTLIGGTVIVEQIFALPGIGQLLLQGIGTRDAPVVQAVVLLLAAITVIANLSVDLLYTALDPRVRHGHAP